MFRRRGGDVVLFGKLWVESGCLVSSHSGSVVVIEVGKGPVWRGDIEGVRIGRELWNADGVWALLKKNEVVKLLRDERRFDDMEIWRKK